MDSEPETRKGNDIGWDESAKSRQSHGRHGTKRLALVKVGKRRSVRQSNDKAALHICTAFQRRRLYKKEVVRLWRTFKHPDWSGCEVNRVEPQTFNTIDRKKIKVPNKQWQPLSPTHSLIRLPLPRGGAVTFLWPNTKAEIL